VSNYGKLRGECAGGKYARGGRVGKDKRGRTVINIVVPPSGASGMQGAPGPAPAPAAPAPSGAAGAPMMPPPAAAMALNQMQGKPQAPGFKRGGRVRA